VDVPPEQDRSPCSSPRVRRLHVYRHHHPRKHRTPEPDPTEHAPANTARLSLLTVTGEGFIPGEDVAVAVALGHSDADGDGVVRAFLTTDQMTASPTGEVVLLGRVSGTYTIGRPA
jgi:hypothetical protein